MKPLEEMTDDELAEAFETFALKITDEDDESYPAIRQELINRLSSHPAQRIADLTGCVVTKDINGTWKQWIMWTIGVAPHKSDDGFWRSTVADYMVVKLPADNHPWQESIYIPRANGKNGGKDESTSAG